MESNLNNTSPSQASVPAAGEFQKPRHWMTLNELTPEYWSDEGVQTRRAQEFYDKPIETLDAIEKLDEAGVSRRDFLTIMGASMAMASFACARRPVNKIIPYVVQPAEATPGVSVHYASSCTQCANSCGIVVKTREGRPIKLEGNELAPNKGALCAKGQASVLDLYDPDRIKGPMKGAKGSSKSSMNWAEADAFVLAALKDAKKVRFLTRPESGESLKRVMNEFMAAFSDSKWIQVDPLGSTELSDGQYESYGNKVVPNYAFEQADYILSFGADFLGTWGAAVKNSGKWSKKRKLDKATDDLSKLVVFEGNLSLTGSNADVRFPILPGSEAAVAAAVARQLIVEEKKGPFAGQADVIKVLSKDSIEDWCAKAGGVSREQIKAIAKELWEKRGKGIVIGSGSVGLQSIVNLLNSTLGNEGAMIDGVSRAAADETSWRQFAELQAEMESGSVDVLFISNLNPVYFSSQREAFVKALSKVKTVIAIADRIDETAIYADAVLAKSHGLESWGDSSPAQGIHSVAQPSIQPLFETRSMLEILIALTRGGVKAQGLLATIASQPKASSYEYVKENWKQTLYPSLGKGQSFIDFWEGTLQKGIVEAQASAVRERSFKVASLNFAAQNLGQLKKPSLEKQKKSNGIEASGVVLGLYEMMKMGDGSQANNAWLQEMPDNITTVTWDNYLNIGPSFAKEMGIQSNDVVTVKSGNISVEVPVNVQPGILSGAATLALGWGRTAAGKVGNQGVNAYPFAQVVDGAIVLGGQTVTIAKTGKRYELAATQEHFKTENRPILNDLTITEFKKDPNAANHTNPHLKFKEVPTMWTPPFDYDKQPYRWMMAVDMNSCTGCGACVVACQAENNIPVVGRDRVRQSREMHWIRIDRYYSGDENNPNVVFQPMMCQHCENAPCETVCPVIATSHSEDGLNQMTYSRCVGTRYCQNNCPYKTRRFNFFDHWKDYKDTANMVWNPDVTVRSRGIMEKCTFCVQRINEAKGVAKDKKTSIKDADLKTACQQTCPTEAIVFGNVNDPSSAISKMKNHPRAFRVLEVLNTKPSVTYLSKVRNVEGGHDHHEEASHGHN